MKRALGAFLLLFSISASPAQAQGIPGISPGDRVRVTAPECDLKKKKGTFISFDDDLFSATLDDQDIGCPVGALTRLDVSVGERKWWKASMIGLGVGAGVGAITAVVFVSQASEYDDMTAVAAIVFGMLSVGAGLVTGTIIGVIRGTDNWKEVPLPPFHPSVFSSRGNRLNLGFSIPLRR